jgi:hypothetical protein
MVNEKDAEPDEYMRDDRMNRRTTQRILANLEPLMIVLNYD